MNKIKVLYDVVKAMRDKESYNGVIEAVVSKDKVQVLQFTNEFSKDLASGWTKARVATVVNHDGKQIKYESTTEFNRKDGNHNASFGHCGLLHRRVRHGNPGREHAGMHDSGLKGRLDRLLAILNALNNLMVTEQADQGLLLTLDMTDIPEELKQNIQARMRQRQHGPADLGFKGLHSIENGTLECKVNKKNEVETIQINLNGKMAGEDDEVQDISCQAEIKFSW